MGTSSDAIATNQTSMGAFSFAREAQFTRFCAVVSVGNHSEPRASKAVVSTLPRPLAYPSILRQAATVQRGWRQINDWWMLCNTVQRGAGSPLRFAPFVPAPQMAHK